MKIFSTLRSNTKSTAPDYWQEQESRKTRWDRLFGEDSFAPSYRGDTLEKAAYTAFAKENNRFVAYTMGTFGVTLAGITAAGIFTDLPGRFLDVSGIMIGGAVWLAGAYAFRDDFR